MEIIDFDHAINVFDIYRGQLTMARTTIALHLDGKISGADSDELPRLEALLRKLVRESSAVAILLYEEAVEQAPLLILYPGKLAGMLSAATKFSIENAEAVKILSRIDTTKTTPSTPVQQPATVASSLVDEYMLKFKERVEQFGSRRKV